MIRTVRVGPPGRGCDVLVGPRLVDRAGEHLAALAPGAHAVILSDRGVADHHGERLAASVEAGGISAELIVAEEAAGAPAVDLGDGDLLVLFGGASLDRALPALQPLFARGVGLVRMPTTLSAQIECVKAEDPGPRLILADVDVLATLEADAVRAGSGLGLRHALAADARLLIWMEAHLADVAALKVPALSHLVAGCVELRAARLDDLRSLALGEDLAAALRAEAPALDSVSAGALGCALAFHLSTGLGLCGVDAAERATWIIAAAGLPARLEEAGLEGVSTERLVRRLTGRSGSLDLILARDLGQAFHAESVDPDAIAELLLAEGCMP